MATTQAQEGLRITPRVALVAARRGSWLTSNYVLKTFSILALLLAWTLLAWWLPAKLLPFPWVVAGAIWRILTEEAFLFHMSHTLMRVVAGFALAFTVSVLLGVMMGLYRVAERIFDVYVLVGLTIPGFCWAIIALIWFGISELAAIFAVFIITLPITTMNMWKGTQAVDKELLEMGQAFNADRRMLIQDVVLPQLMPYIFAAVRFGFSYAWKVVVISEMLGLSNGVGYQINMAYALFSMRDVLAWTAAFVAVMFLIEYGIFRRLELYALRWRPEIQG